MGKENTKNYLLQIPESLHKKLKMLSVRKGVSMRAILQKGLEKELKPK